MCCTKIEKKEKRCHECGIALVAIGVARGTQLPTIGPQSCELLNFTTEVSQSILCDEDAKINQSSIKA